jgi:hypothetical protein
MKDGHQHYCVDCFRLIKQQHYLDNADKQKAKSRAKYASNKEKHTATVIRWIENNPRQVKNTYLLKKYKITLEQYETLFQKQDGRCALCSKHQTELRISLAVDHCHKTNKIRGLLCDTCNRGIGFLKEDKEILAKAIDYLDHDKVLDMGVS